MRGRSGCGSRVRSAGPAAAGLLLAAGLTAEYLTGAPAWLRGMCGCCAEA